MMLFLVTCFTNMMQSTLQFNKNNEKKIMKQEEEKNYFEYVNFDHFQSIHNQFSETRRHDAYLLYLDLKYAKQQPLQEYHRLEIKAYPTMERYCIHGMLRLPFGKDETELNNEIVDMDNPLTQVTWKEVSVIFVPISTNEDLSFNSCWKICDNLAVKDPNIVISFAFVDSDSSITYYRMSQNMNP